MISKYFLFGKMLLFPSGRILLCVFLLLLSWFFLTVSISFGLYFSYTLDVFETGLTGVFRGITPQIYVKKSQMVKNDLWKIKEAVEHLAPEAICVNEYFGSLELRLEGTGSQERQDIIFKTKIKTVNRDHLKIKALQDFIPVDVLNRLVSEKETIAISRQLRDGIKETAGFSNDKETLIKIKDAYGNVRDVEVVHNFDMLQGRYARVAVASEDFVAVVNGTKNDPNRVGVELPDEIDIDDFMEKLSGTLNASTPKTHVEKHAIKMKDPEADIFEFAVRKWQMDLYPKVEKFTSNLKFFVPVAAFFLLLPVLLYFMLCLVLYLHNRLDGINLFKLFGMNKRTIYLLVISFCCFLGAGSCFAGYFGFRTMQNRKSVIDIASYFEGIVSLSDLPQNQSGTMMLVYTVIVIVLCLVAALKVLSDVYRKTYVEHVQER